MRIKNITISGFQSENRWAHAVFSDGGYSVIYAPNGSGKTILLQILHAFLSKNESILSLNKVHSIECVFYDDFEEKEKKVQASKQKNGSYEWDTKSISNFDKLKSLTIGVDRGIATQNMVIQPHVIFDFMYRYSNFTKYVKEYRRSQSRDSSLRDELFHLSMELSDFIRRNSKKNINMQNIDYEVSHLNINTIKMENIEDIISLQYREARYKTTKKIQSALFDTLASVIENYDVMEFDYEDVQNMISDLVLYRDRIKLSLDNGETNAFMKSVLSALDDYCDGGYILSPHKPIIIKLFENIINELKVEDQTLNSINILIATFNKLLEGNKKLIVDEKKSAYIEVDGEKHAISELSSGERHILTFLTLVSTVGKNRNFLIIDEPEISLNINWQRIIIPTIKNILPNCQIIVASHSPFLSQEPKVLCALSTGRI